MKKVLIFIATILVAISSIDAKEITKATTEDGRSVVLFSDGTWVFKPKGNTVKEPIQTTKPQSAKESFKGTNNSYIIHYDDRKWKIDNTQNSAAEFSLVHKNGDGYAMAIYDRIPIPLKNLKNIALMNAQDFAPGAKIVEESTRVVNGTSIMVLKIKAKFEGMEFLYYGYYSSGDWGALQFITYTASAFFDEYKEDFTKLLNGLVIKGK